MHKLFLDANVLFSAAYRTNAGIRKFWELPGVELVTSVYAVEEARRNLSNETQREALEILLQSVIVLDVPTSWRDLPVALPEKDQPILQGAIEAQATHLITGDFRDFGSYYGQSIEGVLIVPPAAYFKAREGEGESGTS